MAHVGDVPIGSSSLRFRAFGGHHASLGRIGQGVGDEERIATHLFELAVRQVRRVTLVHHSRDQLAIGFLVEEKGALYLPFLDPSGKAVFSGMDLVVDLGQDLDASRQALVDEPFPEFRHLIDAVVVPMGVDQDVRVEEVEQGNLLKARISDEL